MKYVLTILLLGITAVTRSQCGNSDFELGNFTGWSARTGSCCPIILPNGGFVANRQTIMTQGIDPRTCGNLRTVYQGRFSARLGNERIGAQAEGLSYSFVVTPATTIIRYAYAVVFQDPNHLVADQPRFQSRVRLADGSVILCTDYTVTAASNLPGFQYCAPASPDTVFVAWRDWTEVAVDLSAYIGQSVALEFETGDCRLRGHYGYAYIDAVECGQSTNHITYCQKDTSLVINGLGGFASYLWETGDTTQNITINPQLYDTLTCQVTTFLGCQLTLYYILDSAPGIPNFNWLTNCNGLVQFTNTSQSTYTPINYLWTFSDGSTSIEENPIKTFSSGPHDIRLQISSNLGCEKDTTIRIIVPHVPQPSFTVAPVCLGQPSIFLNTSSQINGYQTSYLWDFGDGSQSIVNNPNHTYLNIGTFDVSLTATFNSNPPCSGVYYNQAQVNAVPLPIGPINHN